MNKKIQDIISKLNQASLAYYNTDKTIMSDAEYDKLYDELVRIEKETGIIISNSPTHKIGAEVVSKLETVEHNHPMLSLDKCHSVKELLDFARKQACLLMMKMDGLTVSLEYADGKLVKAETRGDGTFGSNILHNAKVFKNLPLEIAYKDRLIIDGEVVIKYDDFERINNTLPKEKAYKNPRNLASGSLQLLDSEVAATRQLNFVVWKVIKGFDGDSNLRKLEEAKEQGFTITPYYTYYQNDEKLLSEMLEYLREQAKQRQYPIDGAVMLIDSISDGEKLGRTDKFFNHSIAYKYEDTTKTTELIDVDWTINKTGILTPTAVFKPVNIEGSTIERASLHNVSIFESLKLGVGDDITVYKANAIIPQIESNLSQTNTLKPPMVCPVCESRTEIRQDNQSKVLYCTNLNCKGKLLGKFANFVSKQGMNIDGFSEATLSKFIDIGWLKTFDDIYKLDTYKTQIINSNGFGQKSWDNLWNAIQASKSVNLENFIVAVGIEGIGKAQAKIISTLCNGDWFDFEQKLVHKYDFSQIDGFGNVLNKNLHNWYDERFYQEQINVLTVYFTFTMHKYNNENKVFKDKTVVITGSFEKYTRDELQTVLESMGAKVSNSVSKKTSLLICGENAGSKLTKAKELGAEIINEEQLVKITGKVIE